MGDGQRVPEMKALLARFRALRITQALGLFAPPLLAEIVIHITADGQRRVYASKIEPIPERIAIVAQQIIAAGLDYGKQYGINITAGDVNQIGRQG